MRLLSCLALSVTAFTATSVAAQTQTDITDFAKTDNIYTNLNQQFPNTGAGVPGSTVGVANASFLFTPTASGAGNPNNVNYANNGISYLLKSDASGRDFTEVGTANFGVASVTLPINVADATAFYLLAAAYVGSNFDITFSGTGGYSQTFSNIGLPDFSGGSTNYVGGGITDQTVFRVYDTGAGGTGNSSNGATGYYDLTQVGFDLGTGVAGKTLTSATITGLNYETLILGATAVSPTAVVGAVPEPASWAMMIVGFGMIGTGMRYRRRRTMLRYV